MILFKWFMMFIGTVMVSSAIVIMITVIHAGATGRLKKHHFRKNGSGDLSMTTFTSEDLFQDTTISSVDSW
jgi:hypothetical protein